ncbi:Repeat domain-containing protein [Actinacidiphila alni]|uniref:Repeat domain-containing protein n=1 Tax=Actinacidiphila alni TaxID=380248 RepID=A0A1I1ZPQ7_9ACTN|nr:VCBS repeat-containing protein [Actinacidiphila alni]SFE33689.1 Repeat domain-containing protein [Actinacidiphila alni]
MSATAGLGLSAPSAGAADAPQETVVPAGLSSVPLSASLFTDGAGAQGVFQRVQGVLVWTRYADGRSVRVPDQDADPYAPSGLHDDALAHVRADGGIDVWNAVDGTTRTLRVPQDQTVANVEGTTALTFTTVTAADGTTGHVYHLLTPGPGDTTRDVTVTGAPDGMTIQQPIRAADDTSLVLVAKLADGTGHMVAVDRETGRVQGWTPALATSYINVSLSARNLVVWSAKYTKILVFPRSDLSAAPRETVLDGADAANVTAGLTLVGDWVVRRPGAGKAVVAEPLSGGPSVTLATSDVAISSSSHDTAVVKGSTTAGGDVDILRIAPGPDADGRPVVTRLTQLSRLPVPVQGLSLDQGRLVVSDASSGRRDTYVRTVAATGTPEFGDRSAFTDSFARPSDKCPVQDAGCSAIEGTADGRVAWVERESFGDSVVVNGPGPDLDTLSVPAGGRIADVSGTYLIYAVGGLLYVHRLGDGVAPTTFPARASAIWGDVLLTAGSAPGSITGFNLTTRKPAATLTTDAGCVPTELQANGRWLYWSCGPEGPAGVYDRTAKKSVPVPSDEARLGDGFVVTHDRAAGTLTLTTVTGGKAVGRVIGDLPDTGVSQRDVRWTVDESGPNAAYVDAENRVHLVPSGAPAQPLRLLAPADSFDSVDAHAPDTVPVTLTRVLLSKPAADWTLTVRNAQGKVVDTRHGGAARGEVRIDWRGVDPALPGVRHFPNGRYVWSLSFTPADGQGAPLAVTGSVRLMGAPTWRDLVGEDGYGDLLGLDGTGRVFSYQSTGTGGLGPKQASDGGTFPTTSLLVPFGDTDGDGCDDVLVRVGDELRAYREGCNSMVSASSPHVSIGKGWGQYNVLTSPGDLNGDGHLDLIARQTSTGDIYFYAGTATQQLKPRVRIGVDWKLYSRIIGAGDLNGDGRGDLLGLDTSGGLWRYYARPDGTVTPRVRIATNWGKTYTAVLGTGDLTGDARPDLVARDTTGRLFRLNSTSTGTFAAPVLIGTGGWNTYKGLF